MPVFSANGLIGANTDRKTPPGNPEFNLGHPFIGRDNSTWVYVQASGAIAAGAACSVSGTFIATNGAGNYTNGATPFALGEFGWVRKTASPL